MRIVHEDLWLRPKNPNTMFVVTTNAVVRNDESLVMGAGTAKQAVERIPDIATEVVDVIRETKDHNFGYYTITDYGFAPIRMPSNGRFGFGVFQTKRHWMNDAIIEVIQNSINDLATFLALYPEIEVRMPMPGVGLGNLKVEDVMPRLNSLVDRVTICVR